MAITTVAILAQADLCQIVASPSHLGSLHVVMASQALGNASQELPNLRCKLAAAVGFACRKLWRRRDICKEDEISLDLLVEALGRLGHLYRPAESASATVAIRNAPPHIR